MLTGKYGYEWELEPQQSFAIQCAEECVACGQRLEKMSLFKKAVFLVPFLSLEK